MKNLFIVGLLLISAGSFAQILEPVKWNYRAKKISDKSYEIHITAIIENGWHLYSQVQPADAITIPTRIKFSNNPLLSFKDKIKEIGTLEKKKEPTLGIEAWQYSNKVDFIQLIQLKNIKVKTKVKGTIEFQTCTNEKCLPSKTITFTIAIK